MRRRRAARAGPLPPARDDRHGPARRPGAGLRQRRRRAVRPRAAAGAGEEAARAPRRPWPRSCAPARPPGPDPPLLVDADLRPEGRQGPLVRTLGAYRGVLRALVGAVGGAGAAAGPLVAGDADLGEGFIALADELRYPAGGLADGRRREIRRIKARVEAERMPRGVDPARISSSALAGWPTWSGRSAVAAAPRRRVPALRTTAHAGRAAAAAGAGLVGRPTRSRLRVLAARHPDQERDHAGRGRGADVLPARPRRAFGRRRVAWLSARRRPGSRPGLAADRAAGTGP